MTTTTYPPDFTPAAAAMIRSRRYPAKWYDSPTGNTRFHLAGGQAPWAGVQDGLVLKTIRSYDPAFQMMEQQGAFQDGVTFQDAVYDPTEFDMVLETSASPNSAGGATKVLRDWLDSWSPKSLGKLHHFDDVMGHWWCYVRKYKPFPDDLKHAIHNQQQLTWTARNDDVFWQATPSECTFKLPNEVQTIWLTGTPTSGTFPLRFGGQIASAIPFNVTASSLQTRLRTLSSIGTPNVTVTGTGTVSDPFVVTFVGALAGTDVAQITSPIPNSLNGGATVKIATADSSGFFRLTNRGDQDGWPSYLVTGPGIFSIADGPGSTRMITFGTEKSPILAGQKVLITTLPRLRSIIDVSPTPQPAATYGLFQTLMDDLIKFVTNNNVPPLLSQFESFFGILPPQGVLYSLLNGRFSNTIPAKPDGAPPVESHIAVNITGGTAASNVVASLTPFRRTPD